MFTRLEFEKLNQESAEEMAADQQLRQDALKVLVQADRYRWIHQTNWLGEPILNLPQDMFALQEIIYKTRPKYIIEVGVAWGGSLLFYSTLMEVLGGERIIGVDIYIPGDLRERLASYGKLSERLTLINGSSVEKDTLRQIKSIVGGCREVMVFLDSFHTHGPGNNPKTALGEFLKENGRFEIDRKLENKLLFTCNPGGYLVCTKD
jgi:cephalosporin hydroxylase